MISVNQTSSYMIPGVVNNTLSAASWINKTITPVLNNSAQLMTAAGKIIAPYKNFLSACQPVLTSTGCEAAYSYYQEKQLLHENQNTQTDKQKNTADTADNERLSAQRETLQTLYEQPVWSRMETSTTLLSTLAWNGVSALIAGATAPAIIPTTASAILVTTGSTLATRMIKRSVYAYRISQLDSEMKHFNQSEIPQKKLKISIKKSEKVTSLKTKAGKTRYRKRPAPY
ncbi:MAG: hypothetical protein OXD32_00075 [Endozoicomonadaceae bacterium]|nr:hypothetical protein [Endozoicomonadaceae bacterium]